MKSSIFKSLRKSISKIGDYVVVLGPSKVKSFRAVIIFMSIEDIYNKCRLC